MKKGTIIIAIICGMILSAAIGAVIGHNYQFTGFGDNPVPEKEKLTYRTDVRVVRQIQPQDYVDFEINTSIPFNVNNDDETPLFLIKRLINNPIYERYHNNPDVRKVIDESKADNVISFKEYLAIRSVIRDEYYRVRGKQDREELNTLVKKM